MIELNKLGNYRNGRLWIDDFPAIEVGIEKYIERNIKVGNHEKWKEKKIALEISYPRNASNYALLGLEYSSKPFENQLIIRVNIVDSKEKMLYDTLAKSSDEVYIGIPKEYAEVIITVAERVLKDSKLIPTGILTFSIGAHGIVGSSQIIFSKLTEVLLHLLRENSSKLDKLEEYIADLL